MSALENLPLETLENVFSHLGGAQPLVALRNTNKYFRRLLSSNSRDCVRLINNAMSNEYFYPDFMNCDRLDEYRDDLVYKALRFDKLHRNLATMDIKSTGTSKSKFKNASTCSNRIPTGFGDRVVVTASSNREEDYVFLPDGIVSGTDGKIIRGFPKKGYAYEIHVADQTFQVIDTSKLTDRVSTALGKPSPIQHSKATHMPFQLTNMFEDSPEINGTKVHQLVCVYRDMKIPYDYFVYVLHDGEIVSDWKITGHTAAKFRFPLRMEKVACGGGIAVVLYGCAGHDLVAYDLKTGEELAEGAFPNGNDSHDLAVTNTHIWIMDGTNAFMCITISDFLSGKQDKWRTVVSEHVRGDFYIANERFYDKYILASNGDKLQLLDVMKGEYKVYGPDKKKKSLSWLECDGLWAISANGSAVYFDDRMMYKWGELYDREGMQGPQKMSYFQEVCFEANDESKDGSNGDEDDEDEDDDDDEDEDEDEDELDQHREEDSELAWEVQSGLHLEDDMNNHTGNREHELESDVQADAFDAVDDGNAIEPGDDEVGVYWTDDALSSDDESVRDDLYDEDEFEVMPWRLELDEQNHTKGIKYSSELLHD